MKRFHIVRTPNLMTTYIHNFLPRFALSFLLVAASFFTLMGVAFAASDNPDISSRDAFLRQQQGDIIIVDVRNEDEWRHTGIADGALPISMQDQQFIQKIIELRMQQPGKDIAFICASSRRSGVVQGELEKRGFDGVYSVFGGMTGNGTVPGWIVDGLPVSPWSGPGN